MWQCARSSSKLVLYTSVVAAVGCGSVAVAVAAVDCGSVAVAVAVVNWCCTHQ